MRSTIRNVNKKKWIIKSILALKAFDFDLFFSFTEFIFYQQTFLIEFLLFS